MNPQPEADRSGRTNLPAELTPFIGRRREVGDVKRLLGGSRLVTLTGVGGVGKTRLAKRVAEEVQRAFAAGVWFVDLAPLEDASLLNRTVAGTLGMRDDRDGADVDALARRVGDKQLLLVLDNCEHLLGACAVLVNGLLQCSPQLRVVCTSRQALGITGEQIVVVPPLAVPARDKALPTGALAQYDAMTLF